MTAEEKKAANRAAAARWLAKPGNREKHRKSVSVCRQRPHSKEAHRKRSRERAATMRERERLRAAEWRKNNPQKATATHRSYYERNAARVKAANKTYRLKNLDAYKEYGRQYKGKRRAGGGRLSKGYITRLMCEQNGLCVACTADLKVTGFHIDHITPISKGGLHCDTNVQLLCPTCNRRKSAKNFEDFCAQLRLNANVGSEHKQTKAGL